MQKINFEEGELISPPHVDINGEIHNVIPAAWQGNTPLSPYILNLMQQYIEEGTISNDNLQSISDCNDPTIKTGFYYASNTANIPFESAWYILHLKHTASNITQIAFRYKDNEVFIRNHNTSVEPTGWKPWAPLGSQTVRISENNANLNDFLNTGIYYFSSNYTPINIPAGVCGWLVVLRGNSDTVGKQIWFRQTSSFPYHLEIFIRSKLDNENWSDWYKISFRQLITTGSELAIDEHIDGKQVYRKRISIGELPNNTTKTVSTGLTHKTITPVKILGSCRSTDGTSFPLPCIRFDNTYSIAIWLDVNNKLCVQTGMDRTDMTGYVDIYYTKN